MVNSYGAQVFILAVAPSYFILLGLISLSTESIIPHSILNVKENFAIYIKNIKYFVLIRWK